VSIHPDVVYRWIDPSAGAAKLARALASNAAPSIDAMNTIHRYRDNGELRYSMRSVHRYAPWVRHIHVLGEGQAPTWLGDHPRVSWHDPLDLMRRHGIEPQLSSETQKLVFSKIPGLSEHFLCFDDDWLLGRPLRVADFYTGDGMPLQPLDLELHGWHAPVAWTRALYHHALAELPGDLRQAILAAGTSRVEPTRWMRAHLRDRGLAIATPQRNAQAWLRDTNVAEYRKVLEDIEVGRPQTYCLNDDWSTEPATYAEQMGVLQAFFERMYPDPAPWERV
jgi:hypothetical protein